MTSSFARFVQFLSRCELVAIILELGWGMVFFLIDQTIPSISSLALISFNSIANCEAEA